MIVVYVFVKQLGRACVLMRVCTSLTFQQVYTSTKKRERQETEKRNREKEGRGGVCGGLYTCVCVVCVIVRLRAGARVQQLDTPGYAPKKHSLHLSMCGRAS